MDLETFDPGLREANRALTGRRQREAHRFASIELRITDPRTGPWEVAAAVSVLTASMLFVLGLWFI